MTTEETTEALIEWAVEVLPELAQARARPEGDLPFPDLCVSFSRVQQIAGKAGGRLQQGHERVRTFDLILLVDDEPADDASESLGRFCDKLMDELVRDRTLAGRVASADATAEASLIPPFVDIIGGGQARQATLTLTVRDQVAL